jgi:hypothetical protein
MKKTVKVEAIIELAKQEVNNYNKFMADGKYDEARMVRDRIDSYHSIIMVLAVGYCKDFDDKWDEIHKQIWGE